MSALIYLLQVSACIALFYGFYYFMLNRLTFFTINRYYLLFTLLISFIIPLLTIHLHQTDNYPRMVQQVVYVNTLQNMPLHSQPIVPVYTTIAAPSFNWPQLLKTVYLLAVIALFIHLLFTLINFFAKLRNRKTDRIGHVNILHGNKSLTNGSFLNYIFLNDDELSPDELQQVIAHEMLHVKLLHSIDRIVAKIIQIILWFNPFIYLYIRSIEENHEFEVDREISRSTDKNNYAELLLHLSIARGGMLYHGFSKVPLKKRIAMLFNKPSANMKRIIYVLVIPVVLISCLAFARLKNDDKKPVDKKIYSVVTGAAYNGKDPLVLIDGKVYPSAILYEISDSCINVYSSSGPGHEIDIKKYGPRATIGIVNIKTKSGVITYMTPSQKEILKENSIKEAAVPLTQFYTLLILKNDDGKPYDKRIINFKNGGSEAAGDDHGAKVAFFIDGKRYSEDYIKKLSPAVAATLGGGGVANPKNDPKKWPTVQDCESVIYFDTIVASKNKPAINATTQQPAKTQLPPPVVRPAPPAPVRFPPPIPKPNPGGRNYMSKVNLALLRVWANDVAGSEKCLDSIKDKNLLLLALNEVAWQLALESRNLDYAEKISKQSLEIINEQLKHPVAGQFGSVDETRKELNHDIFMVGDTYGYVLYKEGKYAEALKVLKPLYDRLPKKEAIGIPPHYAEALAGSNNYIKAKEVAEQWIKFGNITAEPTLERELENNALRASYIKTKGNDNGYNEYVAGLKKVNAGTRRMDAISFPADMVEFYAQPYTRQLKPNARLGDFLKLLPGIKIDNKNTLFFEGQLIDKITIMAPGAASSIRSQEIMANFPADRVMFLRIMNNHSKDPNKKPGMNIFVNLIKAD